MTRVRIVQQISLKKKNLIFQLEMFLKVIVFFTLKASKAFTFIGISLSGTQNKRILCQVTTTLIRFRVSLVLHVPATNKLISDKGVRLESYDILTSPFNQKTQKIESTNLSKQHASLQISNNFQFKKCSEHGSTQMIKASPDLLKEIHK